MSLPAQANTVVAPLSDGRLEMWYTDNGKLWSTWQTSTEPNAAWTPVAGSNLPSNVHADGVSVYWHPDGRLQLFVSSPHGTYTASKITADPNSGWTNWVRIAGK